MPGECRSGTVIRRADYLMGGGLRSLITVCKPKTREGSSNHDRDRNSTTSTRVAVRRVVEIAIDQGLRKYRSLRRASRSPRSNISPFRIHIFGKQSIDEIVNAAPRILYRVGQPARPRIGTTKALVLRQCPSPVFFHQMTVTQDYFAPEDSRLWRESVSVLG